MPRYNYRRADTGLIVEVTLTIAEMQRRQRPDGSILLGKNEAGSPWNGARVKAFRDFASELGTIATQGTGWPLLSEGAGVQQSQVKEATEHARKLGVPTDFTRDGRAIFRDRNHRKQYLKAHGLHDRNGGYGD